MKALTRSLKLIATMAVLLFMTTAGSAQADEWWNDQWQFRRKISFDASEAGANIKSTLADVPLLVRLHSGNFDFTKSSDTGEDIRFVSGNGQTLLKHHIEKFDPIDEIGYIWVRVPRISGGTVQDFIWIYYGNDAAVGGQDSPGTFEAGHAAVFHLGELEGFPKDATAYANHTSQFQAGQGLPSVVGNGITLSGAGDHLMVPASPSIDFSNGFTFSAWLRIQQAQDNATLFARTGEEGRGIFVRVVQSSLCFEINDGSEQVPGAPECAQITHSAWHHVAVTAQSGGRMEIYVDGQSASGRDLTASWPQLGGDLFIGSAPDGSGSFVGDLDEVRISNIARSADWIRVAFISQGADNHMLTQVGAEEVGEGGSGLPVFYLATVMKNITLDGWAVISCLAVLGLLSWIIFFTKATLLFSVEKENKAFKATYAETPDPIAFSKNGNSYDNSTLYRVFSAGLDALKRCIEKNGGGKEGENKEESKTVTLDRKAGNTIKAALERGFIEESERLNSWLVILTMGISGGPFLGLLGTVWGVMNTFAAMAEAGEANIMAIAPGVASALSTTVIGLIVAIPALFGYNYLTGRIKSITAEMMIIVDQLSVNIEEIYGASK